MESREYIPQICISADDPVNSVKGIDGSVIGILFEKSGTGIISAIGHRLEMIDTKISEYEAMCSRTEEFIEEKKKNVKELDEFLGTTKDQKRAYLIPVRKNIERIIKEANDAIYKMDVETFNAMKKKALNFEKGFDGVRKEFDQLNDLLEKDKFILFGSKGILKRGGTGPQGSTSVIRGVTGETGIQGYSQDYDKDGEPIRGVGFGDSLGNIGMGNSSPSYKLEVSTDPETKAYARLKTLRNLLEKNMDRLELLKDAIAALKEEKRRLKLISAHITPERNYKLDMNMLSAFGFEDSK